MNIQKSIEQFLPKYLSEQKQENLLQELKEFPDNLDSRFYTSILNQEKIIFQGDCFEELYISNFPSSQIVKAKCIVTSNTCDIDPSNNRLFESRLSYAPLLSLDKYRKKLLTTIDESKVNDHIKAIKAQKITQILYLPKSSKTEEAIVFLDRINNCRVDVINKKNIQSRRLFTLSNYGFYMLLLKLSISFTRIGEGVDRNQ